MKTAIHPKWFSEAKVICACGNTFTTGATMPEIRVEVCSSWVDAFRAKMKGTIKHVSKTEKRKAKKLKKLQEEAERPESLSELRKKD